MTEHPLEPLNDEPTSLEWLRNSFAAGVAIVLPFALTFWVIWTFVAFVDHHVIPFLPRTWRGIAETIPGVGLLIALVSLTLLGAFAGNLLGRVVVNWVEYILERVPLVRSIYGGSKQILNQLASSERTSFKEAVLVEFPRPGVWMIGFLTSDAPAIPNLPPDVVCVYVPHAPVPASGFLAYVPRDQLKPLGLSPEEALKRVLSLGLIKDDGKAPTPETKERA